jgi:hypothetical protein
MKNKHYDSKFLFVGAGIALILFGVFVFSGEKKDSSDSGHIENSPSNEQSSESDIPDEWVQRLSDGVFVAPEDQIEKMYGVMVENSAEAWPLSGISKARIVFEAPVEGSIPRFMAVYDNKQEVDEIGPVRSARPYYVRWAHGMNLMYTHVGGSPEALSLLDTLAIPSLNQFYFSKFFWRSIARYAPHNVYTSTAELENGFVYKDYDLPDLNSFVFAEDEYKPEEDTEQKVSLSFSISDLYDVMWEFDAEKNLYRRHQGGDVQKDKDGSEVNAANVVVLITDIRVIDEVGRKSVRTDGSGDLYIYRNGAEFYGTWKKEGSDSSLELFDENGEIIELNPGMTWIEILPDDSTLEVEGGTLSSA